MSDMKKSLLFSLSYVVIGAAAAVTLSGCADLADPYSGGGYYNNDPYYNDGYYERRERDRNRRERERLEREREALEDEREDLERDRKHDEYKPPVVRPPAQEHCPPGFSPSEQKCSAEERRHGCKDIRLNSGLGCVRR